MANPIQTSGYQARILRRAGTPSALADENAEERTVITHPNCTAAARDREPNLVGANLVERAQPPKQTFVRSSVRGARTIRKEPPMPTRQSPGLLEDMPASLSPDLLEEMPATQVIKLVSCGLDRASCRCRRRPSQASDRNTTHGCPDAAIGNPIGNSAHGRVHQDAWTFPGDRSRSTR